MPKSGQETSPTSVMAEEGKGGAVDVAVLDDEGNDDDLSATMSKPKGGKSTTASGYTSKEPHDQDVLLGRGKPVSLFPISV
jgi:hypothetical protein